MVAPVPSLEKGGGLRYSNEQTSMGELSLQGLN